MSKKLFCSCSLKVASRIRHNKVLFVLHHTMSTMFLVALLVQSFPEFLFQAARGERISRAVETISRKIETLPASV